MANMNTPTGSNPWVYPITLSDNTHNVVFSTSGKFLDRNIRAEISVSAGEVTPILESTNIGTYFTSGTSSSNSISLIPKATNTKGFVAAHDSSSPITGTAEYYSIITTTPSFTGGALNNKAASAEFTNITTSSTDNGILVQTKGTAGRAAVTYTNTAGWLAAHSSATNASSAVSASTWNGTAYYITGITVPKDKGFTVTTTADTALDTTSDLDITNAAYRRVDITNAANGSVIVNNAGNITSTQSAKSGTISINAYDTSGATAVSGAKTIVEGGVWKTTAASGANTYYGRVTVAAISGSIGGSASGGSATAVITNTNSLNATTSAPSGTAGTDYWQIKATATGGAGSYTPKYTVNTAGWLASTVTGTAQTVSVSSDSTGKSLYIPRATFSTSNNVVYCATAGYIPAGSAESGIATIAAGTITNNTTLPSGTSSSGTINRTKYIKIGAGYYASDAYYLAQGNSGTKTITGSGTTSVDGYANASVAAVSASLGGSTSTTGKATAAITNTNSVNTITTLTGKTAGADYWEIKATASITTTPKFTPSLTLTTAGWMATAPTGSATNVTVNGDSTGKSLYIPKAVFSRTDNVVYCSSAGYVPQGSEDSGIFTVTPGTIGTTTTDPGTGYTENTSTVVPSGGYLTLTAGYYDATKISLATLVPNGSNVAGHADYLLAGKTAYDNNGVLVTGNIATYAGAYEVVTS